MRTAGLRSSRRIVQPNLHQMTGLTVELTSLLPALIEHIPTGILVAYGAPQFPIVVVNAMAEQLLGCTRSELLGTLAGSTTPGYQLLLSGGTVPMRCNQMPLHRTAHLGEGIRDEEFTLERPDGSRITVLVNTNPIRNTAGDIVGAVNCLRDITHLKAVEKALRTSETQLRHADQRKDEFVATLAHELRGPLTPVRNVAEILQLKSRSDPELQRLANLLTRQVSDMSRLLDDVLDLSRVALGKLALKEERVELADVITHALEWSGPLVHTRQHRLSVRLPSHPVHVCGDAGRLAQVFSNLLSNAAKYTDPAGDITVALKSVDGEARVSIRDTGRGLEPKDLRGLFDLFRQLEGTLDRAEGGLGIGLSLVQSLVRMHGGRVEVHSAGRGKGSEFAVCLPLADA